jgi:GT2 family glycosyltransferase
MTRVSVVIPLHNGGDDLCRCLQALAASIQPPDEVIVVDDASTDGSAALARTLGARVLTLSHGPQGPAVARNRGAAVAQGDILVFLDADVAISPDAMDQIVAAFRREPDLAALFGSYDDAPAATDFLSQYKNLFHHYVHQTACEEASTFFGACGAIRRDVFLALGGYDERYRQPSIEDIELGYRLTGAGHRIRLCKTLQVKHLKGWDVVSLLKADFFHRALPWTELILRDRRFINDLNLQFSSRVSVMLVYGLLGALVGVWWWPGSLAVAGVLMLVLLALNAPLYRFVQRKRGLRFALQTIPWHWFYYFYSGLAFAIGVACYLSHGWRLPRACLPVDREELSGTARGSELR